MFLDEEQMNSLILELGLVTQGDFNVAEIEASEKRLNVNDVLVRKGIVSKDEIQEVQARVTGVDFIDLKNKKIEREILVSIPEPISRKYDIISFDRDENILKVAVLDLSVLDKIDFLKRQVTLKIVPYLTDQTSIKQNLLKYQELLKDEYGAVIQKEFLAFQTISEDSLKDLTREKILELARDKKINTVFELFLKHALLQKASNIHIEPHQNKTLIKYRIGGKLYSAMVLPKNASLILNLKIKALIGLESNEEIKNFTIGFDGRETIFQVNTVQTLWGERIVLNILYQGDSGFSLESLGFHGKALDVLYSEIDKKDKTILITGKQSSGKTTTFYTFLDSVNDFNLAIGTIENTIGFQMNGLSQTVVDLNIGFDISQGINKLNKQNLDVLGVDKIESNQDLETLFKPRWSDRFNLVILETEEDSGVEIIFKLKKLKINPVTIVANLSTIISQKLIPKLKEENKKEYYLNVNEIKNLSKKIDLEKVMNSLVDENILEDEKPWSEIVFFKSKDSANKE